MADDTNDPSGIGANVSAIRGSVHDMLYKHPILGPVLKLVEVAERTNGSPKAASPSTPDLGADLPPVKDIALPVAKPIELPRAATAEKDVRLKDMAKRPLYSDAEVSPGLRANRDYHRKRSLAGGRR